jgi:2-iminobutanoate/2-iminopropanoate deaminase
LSKRIIRTTKAVKPVGAYSQGVVASGNLVFVAGQGGLHPKTLKAPKGIAAQTRQTFDNIKAILEAAGTSLDNVVKVGVFLRDLDDFDVYNKTYLEYFPKDQPARITVQAKIFSKLLIEADAVAVLPEK